MSEAELRRLAWWLMAEVNDLDEHANRRVRRDSRLTGALQMLNELSTALAVLPDEQTGAWLSVGRGFDILDTDYPTARAFVRMLVEQLTGVRQHPAHRAEVLPLRPGPLRTRPLAAHAPPAVPVPVFTGEVLAV